MALSGYIVKVNSISCLVLIFYLSSIDSRQLNYGSKGFWPWPLQIRLDGSDVCRTDVCKEAAAEILSSLNVTADPCEDFYEFACGGWVKNHPVPPSQAHMNQFDVVMKKVDNELKEILEAEDKPDDIIPVKAARQTYRACMDTDYIEKSGLKPLSDLLEVFGDWPMATEAWDEKKFNLQESMAELIRLVDVSPLVSTFVYLDRKNSSQSVIMMDQPSLSIPRSMLIDASTYGHQLEAYRRWIMGSALEIIKSKGAEIPTTRIGVEAYEVIEFEIHLAHITTPSEKRRNAYRMYNPLTIEDLQGLTDSVFLSRPHAKIDWQSFLETLFSDHNMTFTPDERVVVREVDYLLELVALLDSTPARTLANYLQWRLVKKLSKHSNENMKKLAFQFDKVYIGTTEHPPLWRECVGTVSSTLGFALGYSYVSQFFNEDSKTSALQMVENIRSQFSSSFHSVDWMDVSTRFVAQDKAEAMKELIGYPDWFSNTSDIEEYYTGLSVGPSHLDNIVSLLSLMVHRTLSKLHLPTDRSEWITSPETVNAYYNPQTNSITFPAGILQPPFFSKGRPDALNYGSIGVVIGHELVHGFDDMGRQSDKYGNLAQWWSDATIDTYLKKAECFIKQYSMYRVPELDKLLNMEVTMNGFTTQGENMGDNGGLRHAFLAYQKSVAYNGPDQRLPGLEQYSPQQLFFLSYATVWCESITKESLLQEVLMDPHSPQKFRVRGPLANSKDFSRAWNCPLGSPMNPHHKCHLW